MMEEESSPCRSLASFFCVPPFLCPFFVFFLCDGFFLWCSTLSIFLSVLAGFFSSFFSSFGGSFYSFYSFGYSFSLGCSFSSRCSLGCSSFLSWIFSEGTGSK